MGHSRSLLLSLSSSCLRCAGYVDEHYVRTGSNVIPAITPSLRTHRSWHFLNYIDDDVNIVIDFSPVSNIYL